MDGMVARERDGSGCERRLIRIGGLVQGVGFRPFIYREAVERGLAGWVANGPSGVTVDVEGDAAAIVDFVTKLPQRAPTQARIESLTWESLDPIGQAEFVIHDSLNAGERTTLVPPDLATCPDCLRELFDPADRRYRYPFINCTNCGPRYTIIDALPYDRPATTMRAFAMCERCDQEYRTPADRRFHAQPDACPDCGPHVWFTVPGHVASSGEHPATGDAALMAAVAALLGGGIIAIKGLGGFHLACDAGNQAAVERLRRLKARPVKPFALMVADIAAAERLCHASPAEAALLTSPRAPIVLLDRRQGADRAGDGLSAGAVAPAVAPGQLTFGVMLPATPLHHLLLRQVGRPLVMTSGNISEEPLVADNTEAEATLGPLAGAGLLLHDREISHRCDDSVTRVVAGRTLAFRRARGCAPAPLPFAGGEPPADVIACGGQEKSAFCVTHGGRAFLSHHCGELANPLVLDFFTASLDHYRELFAPTLGAVACDLHPDYVSSRLATRLASETGARLIRVQHHHAHVAAVLGEHDLTGPVIGVAYDGTGLGDDGALWGGEILICDRVRYRRFAHLAPFPLPGGERAIERPYRTAYGLLADPPADVATAGHLPPPQGLSAARALIGKLVPAVERSALDFQLRCGLNVPLTTSVGRLFDAAAAVCGFAGECSYDAEAAIWLETLAGPMEATLDEPLDAYPSRLDSSGLAIDGRTIVSALAADLASGTAPAVAAQRFHATVALATRDLCRAARAETGIVDVCLAGGVFMNRRLLVLTERALATDGFRVHLSQEAPLNDGGLAYGQAVVARARLAGDPEGTQALSSSDLGRGDPHVRRLSRHDSHA